MSILKYTRFWPWLMWALLLALAVAMPSFAQEAVGTVAHAGGVVDAIDGMGAKVPGWIALLTAIMVAAKVITTVTPTQADNLILAAILRLINIVALNVGKAKNADDKDGA